MGRGCSTNEAALLQHHHSILKPRGRWKIHNVQEGGRPHCESPPAVLYRSSGSEAHKGGKEEKGPMQCRRMGTNMVMYMHMSH